MNPRPANRTDALRRDVAMGRIRRVTRWVAAGAVGAVGALVAVEAHDAPAHASRVTTTPSATGSGSQATGGSGSYSNGSSGTGSYGGGSSLGGSSGATVSPPTQTYQAPQATTGQS